MDWGFRIARRKSEYIHKDQIRPEYDYYIVEAYYDMNGFVGSISQGSKRLVGSNLEELGWLYTKMKEAFFKPILDYDKIPEEGYNVKNDLVAKIIKEDNNPKGWEKLNEDLNFDNDELETYDKEMNDIRIKQEKEFNYYIKEYINDRPADRDFRLIDIYRQD